MSTSTDKKVTRVTTGFYPCKLTVSGRGMGKPRRIALSIMPGDTLILRWHGTQQREYIAIEQIMRIAQTKRVLSERCQKLNAKRRRR